MVVAFTKATAKVCKQEIGIGNRKKMQAGNRKEQKDGSQKEQRLQARKSKDK